MKLADRLRTLARRLSGRQEEGHRPGLGMGELAALRRMDPLAPGKAANVAYSLLHEVGVDLDDTEAVRRWSLIVHALALVRGAHNPAEYVGKTLTAMQFGDARLAQLLSADLPLLSELVPRLARRINAAQKQIDFAPIAELVLSIDRDADRAEAARLSIARSYVRATHTDADSTRSRT